jgi:hypothetical protein
MFARNSFTLRSVGVDAEAEAELGPGMPETP